MRTTGKNGISSEEALQDPRQVWQSAYVGSDFLGRRAYLALLARKDDPTKRIYATLEMSRFGVRIDIPIEDHTSEEEIRHEVNLHPTLWEDFDPDGYRQATETYTRAKLLALLNRSSTGAENTGQVPGRFYDMLGISHGERYDSVFVSSHVSDRSSHVSDRSFNATIEPRHGEFRTDLRHASDDAHIDQAMGFAQLVQESLPHLTVTPLPVEAYVQDVQTTLGFLPSDQ